MEDTRSRWERAFLEALDYDTWGQVEEALEGYQRLQVAAAAEYVENVLQLPMHRREGIGKLAAVLKARAQELQRGEDRGVGLIGMKALKPFMKDIIVADTAFPLAGIRTEGIISASGGPGGVGGDPDELPSMPDAEDDDDGDEPATEVTATDGTLRPPPATLNQGESILSIFIEKWGFKDATTFFEPHIIVSVRDEKGEVLEAVQETPVGKRTTHNYVFFENTVYIQTTLNSLPPGAAIFFEFKHYKVKKRKRSVKAYCFMEMDEIKSGPITLEVYKKPAIYKRNKKPTLLSVKHFYLHLDLNVATVH